MLDSKEKPKTKKIDLFYNPSEFPNLTVILNLKTNFWVILKPFWVHLKHDISSKTQEIINNPSQEYKFACGMWSIGESIKLLDYQQQLE